jgi:hypothetical protein
MAHRGPLDDADSPTDPPRDVEVTWEVQRRPLLTIRVGATAIVLLVLAAALRYGGVLQHYHRPRPSDAALLAPLNVAPKVGIGPDALAAAFHQSLRCQTLRFAASDPSYFRADPDNSGSCRQYDAAPGAIYRQVQREFRIVLDTSDYSCPVRSLPAAVQAELGVCPRNG